MLGDVIGTLNAVLRIFSLRKKVIKCSTLEADVTKFYPFFFWYKIGLNNFWLITLLPSLIHVWSSFIDDLITSNNLE